MCFCFQILCAQSVSGKKGADQKQYLINCPLLNTCQSLRIIVVLR